MKQWALDLFGDPTPATVVAHKKEIKGETGKGKCVNLTPNGHDALPPGEAGLEPDLSA